MNILEILILVILLLSIIYGYKNGFLKTVFSLVAWIVVLVICNIATPMVTEFLIEKTEMETIIQAALDAKIEDMITDAMEDAGFSDSLLDGMEYEIPEEILVALPEGIKTILENEGSGQSTMLVDTAHLACRAVEIMALLLVMVFSRVALMVVNVVLGIASKLPLIGPLDKILGLACGAGKGILWSWILLTIVSIMAITGTNTEWVGYVTDSQLLTWLQENNMILNLLIK